MPSSRPSLRTSKERLLTRITTSRKLNMTRKTWKSRTLSCLLSTKSLREIWKRWRNRMKSFFWDAREELLIIKWYNSISQTIYRSSSLLSISANAFNADKNFSRCRPLSNWTQPSSLQTHKLKVNSHFWNFRDKGWRRQKRIDWPSFWRGYQGQRF